MAFFVNGVVAHLQNRNVITGFPFCCPQQDVHRFRCCGAAAQVNHARVRKCYNDRLPDDLAVLVQRDLRVVLKDPDQQLPVFGRLAFQVIGFGIGALSLYNSKPLSARKDNC